MKDCVREVCVLSIFFGAVLSLCPEGGARQILRILGTVALMAMILNHLQKLDTAPFALEIAKYRELENQLTEDAAELQDRMNRLVIEDELREYVVNKAEQLGIQVQDVYIEARWNADGLWIPGSSRIQVRTSWEAERLSGVLLGELGIPLERQEWITDDGWESIGEKDW